MRLFDLTGKTALVTGGARGVGRMCADALLEHGAEVVITSRRAEAGSNTRDQLSERGTCDLIVADLATREGVATVERELLKRQDRLDILVNNAGVTWGETLDEYPAAAWNRVLGLDVAAPFQVVQATLPLLEEAGRRDRPARVINMGSIDGHTVGGFDNYAYAAAKAGLHQLTRVLAYRLGPRGISVNCLAPGPVHTDMTDVLLERAGAELEGRTPLRRHCRPDDIAGPLVLLSGRGGAHVTGAVIPIDGGLGNPPWWPAGTT